MFEVEGLMKEITILTQFCSAYPLVFVNYFWEKHSLARHSCRSSVGETYFQSASFPSFFFLKKLLKLSEVSESLSLNFLLFRYSFGETPYCLCLSVRFEVFIYFFFFQFFLTGKTLLFFLYHHQVLFYKLMTTAYQNITSGEEVDDPLTHVLVCQQCRYPLVLGCDIIVEKADVWKDQVYPYELDILELEDVWCYSATNPSGTRFDLVRGKPNNNITYDCENSSFHTFFPGFAWNHLSCKCCRHFFGFGFTKLSENPYIVASVAAVLSLLTTSCDGTLSYSSVDELEENLFPSVDFLGYENSCFSNVVKKKKKKTI